MTIDIKLVAYNPFGDRLGELPQPLSIESADPLSDTPSMTVEYSKHAAGHSLLQHPIEIAREVYNPTSGQWIEPANGRFLLIKTEGDRLDPSGNMHYICPGYSWLLNKLIVYPIQRTIIDGQVEDATNTQESARQALNAAEDRLAQSYGLSTDRPAAYQTSAPQDTANIWIDTTDTSSLKYMVYSESTNKWELFGAHTTATVDAYNAWVAHQQSQGQLQDVQGQTKLTKRTFQGKHAGEVMAILINEALTRGNRVSGLVFDFDESTASDGTAWGDTGGTIEVNVGTSLLALLQSFVEQGQLDFRTNGRVLQLFKQETAMMRDQATEVVLRYGLDIDEAPDRQTLEHMANEMLVMGEDGLNFTRSNPESPTPWGVWEASLSQSGVDNEAMGALLATRALEAASGERIERTRALLFRSGSNKPLPYLHYLPGDYVMAPGADGELVRQRIQQITLTKAGQTGFVGGNLVINDRFLEREIRNARNTQALIGGTAGTGGAPGGTDPETYVDLRVPEAPKFLKVGADTTARKGGGYDSFLGISWWWSRNATDGTSMLDNLSAFEVQYRLHKTNQSSQTNVNTYVWRSIPQVDPTMWSTAYGPVDAMTPEGDPATYEVRVRAVGRNDKVSAWSAVTMATMPVDDTPPLTPSRPVATAAGSVIAVEWDGKNDQGGDPPFDFEHVIIEQATLPADAPETPTDTYLNTLPWFRLAERMTGGGTASLYGRTYDRRYAFRLVAVDLMGNESPASAPSGSAAPVALVDTQDIADAIEAEAQNTSTAIGQLDQKLSDADAALAGDITTLSTAPVELHRLRSGEILLDSAVAQEIWSRKVVAQKVQANEVAIGTGSNLLANGAGELGDNTNFEGWVYDTAAWVRNSGAKRSWGSAVVNGTATTSQFMKVSPSTPYLVRTAATGTLVGSLGRIEVIFYDLGGVELGSSVALDLSTSLNWRFYEGVVTSPVGAATAKLRLTSNMTGSPVDAWIWWANLQFTAQIGASLIVKGGITTDHLAALSVQTGQLAANAVTADKANIESLQSGIITSDVFEGGTFYGGLFQGVKFRTHSRDDRGVILSTSGLQAYNSSYEKVFDINSTTGEVLLAGRIKSGVGNGRPNVILSNADSGYNGVDQGLWFTNDGNPYGWSADDNPKSAAGVFTTSSGSTDYYPLQLRGHGQFGGVQIWSRLKLSAFGSATAMLHSDNTLYVRAAGELQTWSEQDTVIGVQDGKVIRFERNQSGYNATNGSAANVYMDANGYIFKSTSSRKYKTDIRTYTPDESVLNLPSRIWRGKWDMETFEAMKDLPRPLTAEQQSVWDRIDLKWHLGTTAEDALENGAGHLVSFIDGEPDGFEYERYVFLIAPFVKILWDEYKQRTRKNAPTPTPQQEAPIINTRIPGY